MSGMRSILMRRRRDFYPAFRCDVDLTAVRCAFSSIVHTSAMIYRVANLAA